MVARVPRYTQVSPASCAQAARLEAQWPQSAAGLLLALAADSPRYEAPLFETGLAECKFNEYPIDTWSRATLAVFLHTRHPTASEKPPLLLVSGSQAAHLTETRVPMRKGCTRCS